MQDVRIITALYDSARTGRAVKIPHFSDKKPRIAQQIRKPGIKKPVVINSVNPTAE